MAEQLSEWCEGDLPPCPDVFNAAAYCLGQDACRPDDGAALMAVDEASSSVWSFCELRAAVLSAAGALIAAGVSRGDRVVILLADTPAFPVAYFGAIAAGAVATPLSSQLSAGEIGRILEETEPKVVLATKAMDLGYQILGYEDLLAGVPAAFAETEAEDPALLIFTSGSGGRPKGVLHAQRAFWARQSMRDGWHGIGPGDRVMHAGAFNWTFTLGVGLTDTWSVGGTAILNAGSRAPEVWSGLAKVYRPTVFAAAPAVFRQMLTYGRELGAGFASLRHAVTAGEKLSSEIAEAWQAATGKPLLEALGMSEVSTYVSTSPGSVVPDGAAGWAQPGRRVAVLDDAGAVVPVGEVGELAVHADDPGLMLEYWRQPKLTRAAYRGDWFCTGDMVCMGADGAIAYAGRRDDQMNAQGYRVDPQEVEAAVMAVAGVADCGAAEFEVRDGVSVIAVWCVAEAGVSLERAGLMDGLVDRLAGYKTPRIFFEVDALPRTANGKLIRRALPEMTAREVG